MTFRCCSAFYVFLALAVSAFSLSAQVAEDGLEALSEEGPNSAVSKGSSFYVIPVQGPIGETTLFAVRSGVKTAIAEGYGTVVLDMKTPGGRLDSTLEIMEVLDRFGGKTITFVNDEAISAGAIIASVTDEIYFTPKAVIGSAEPVSGQGEDINDSMKRKLMSYLNAKMEAYTSEYPFRSDVIRAMMDPDFEFKIGEEVISPKGELLNLTAKRAHEEFGDPPMPLLGSGIVGELDTLLSSLSLDTDPVVKRFEATWSLNLAEFIVTLTPFLLAIAVITVYMEFQMPGFGIFGIIGVSFFVIAIFGHNVAGLSGHEPLLLFIIGVALLALEFFVAPGTLFFAIPGFFVILVSLIWAMADVWPAETPDFQWNWAMFERPLQNLLGGVLMGIVMVLILARFLPKRFIWDRLVLRQSLVGVAPNSIVDEGAAEESSLVGAAAVAATDMMPTGEIEVEGRRYEAAMRVGSVRKGSALRIVAKSDFGYVVEEVQS